MSKPTTIQTQILDAVRGHHCAETAAAIATHIGRSGVGTVTKACETLVSQGTLVPGAPVNGERTYQITVTS
jgi:hypothetical protein